MRAPLSAAALCLLLGCPASDAPSDGATPDGAAPDGGAPEDQGPAADDLGATAPRCEAPVGLADTSSPRAVVGNGTAASCSEAALRAAIASGGVITFRCGAAPLTIRLGQPLRPPLDRDTVIDGGGTITLDGGGATRLVELVGTDYRKSTLTLTLQRLRFVGGKAPATDYVPPSNTNPKCAYGYRDGAGGAVLLRDRRLVVIDCLFSGNQAATPGPDVGGGAIYALGSLGVTIVGSRFEGNSGSNAGAVGLLQSSGTFVNSTFVGNRATGTGQNYAGGDAAGCPGVGHPSQGGAGGNGGAIAVDGSDDTDLTLCGCAFQGNRASELAGALFRTANVASRRTSIDRSLLRDNQAKGGGALYLRNSRPLQIYASAFVANSAEGAGAGQLDDCTLDVVNTTFYGNRATKGLGGAIANYSGTSGVLRNVTFADNRAEAGPGFFSAAIAGQMSFEIYNTLFWNNLSRDAGSPMACGFQSARTGAANLQWPQKRPVGGADDTPCVQGIRFADAQLAAPEDRDGTVTLRPAAGSPALGAGASCPPTDQRGRPRAAACTLGAVE